MAGRCRRLALMVLGSVALSSGLATAQAPEGTRIVDHLRETPGPPWRTSSSAHFHLHVEQHPWLEANATGLLDSLELAWTNAVARIGDPAIEEPIAVFVTTSRTRLGPYAGPRARAVAMASRADGNVIIFAHNDTVRAFTRHEVMHIVAAHRWGRVAPGRSWLVEGLATWADGRCRDASIYAVARDQLALRPLLTARELVTQWDRLRDEKRDVAYALAASLVDFLWETRGREFVRHVWRGIEDPLARSPLAELAAPGSAFGAADITNAWRDHVKRRAGNQPGVDPAIFARFGCG